MKANPSPPDVVTVTLNPAIDRTVTIPNFTAGAVNRVEEVRSNPGGKGVNVAHALRAHGMPVRAIVTAGGPVGAQLRQMLDTAGLDTVVVPIDGEIRSNISLTQPDGTVTKINEAGPVLSTQERECLLIALSAHLPGATRLVCAGSLPAGLPTGWYGEVVELARRQGKFVAVDTSGAPLADCLPAMPDLVKPNVHELAELTGRVPRTLRDVIDAAQEVRNRGAGTVLASLGGDGAVLVDDDGALWGHAPVDRIVSTVGAGDAMLAGYLSCRGNRADALATALQWGAAAVQHEGTLFSPSASRVSVTVTDAIDPERPLHDTPANEIRSFR